MNKEFFKALDLLEKQKGIPKEYMIEKIEAALISAYKRVKRSINGFTNQCTFFHKVEIFKKI